MDGYAAARVTGLRDCQRALRDISRDLPKELRVGLNKVAGVVVTDVRGHVEHVTGRAASSVVPKSTQTAVRIAFGGPKAPYYPWLDFGGSVGRGRNGRGTGSVKRPVVKGGRYVFPAIKRATPAMFSVLDNVVRDVTAKAGLDSVKVSAA
jgi:hypothetical protein